MYLLNCIIAHDRSVGGWGADLINSLTRKKGATQGRELKRAISTIGTPSTRHNTLPWATDPLTQSFSFSFSFSFFARPHTHTPACSELNQAANELLGSPQIAALRAAALRPRGQSLTVRRSTTIFSPLSIARTHGPAVVVVGDEQNDVPKRAAVYVPAGQKSSVSLAQQAAQQLEGASPPQTLEP